MSVGHSAKLLSIRPPVHSSRVGVAMAFGLPTGIVLLVAALASGVFGSGAITAGVLTGGARVVSATGAINGTAVRFGVTATQTPIPTPVPTATPVSSASWWKPGTGALPWQWELGHEIVTTNATDMGTGDTTATGGAALAPVVYDVDGIDNSAADVSALHALGKKVICYVEVGSAGDYYGNDDGSTSYYAELSADGDLGAKMSGYPEYYLNINSSTTIAIVEKMIHDQCSVKKYDGVEPDLDDSYTDTTGFTISEANEVTYLSKLSAYAHSLGLAWGLKNGGDGGNPSTFVPDMVPYIDFAVVEEPYALGTISYFYPTLEAAGKAFFDAEYTSDTSAAKMATYCPAAISGHVNAALFDLNLDGKTRVPCQ